uniref:Uncharacterized protein n=1 Tax=Anguilla anguilla TaxID=7936 RepID=A0A0E9UMY1_ANGAN
MVQPGSPLNPQIQLTHLSEAALGMKRHCNDGVVMGISP